MEIIGNKIKYKDIVLPDDELMHRMITIFTPPLIKHALQYYYEHSTVSDGSLTEAIMTVNQKLLSNPYDLLEVPYWSLGKIDSRVTTLPPEDAWYVAPQSQLRVDAMIDAQLGDFVKQGQAIVSKNDLFKQTYITLCQNTEGVQLNQQLKDAFYHKISNSQVFVEVQGGIMQRSYYEMTQALAQKLQDHAQLSIHQLDQNLMEQTYAYVTHTTDNNLELDDKQKEVVENLVTYPVSVLTGYAGVGKTTLLKAVVHYLLQQGATVQLTAHAGKACFNLTETLKNEDLKPARTIASFTYRGQRIKQQYLIIDEISMVSEEQLFELLRLINSTTRIILIGDRAQLPAVDGVGVLTSLLNYLKQSNTIYSGNLTKVHRQDQGLLLKHVTEIRNGKAPQKFNEHDGTLRYKKISDPRVAVKAYQKMAEENGSNSVSLITPQNRWVDWFNQKLQQEHVDHGNLAVFKGNGIQFAVGDKVLVTKNMYACKQVDYGDLADIYNGFVGRVTAIYPHSLRPHITVSFDNILVTPDGQDNSLEFNFYKDGENSDGRPPHDANLANLQLGYALTVHKAQGSTIPQVFYYLPHDTAPQLLTMELLYTALTRAEHLYFLTDMELKPSMLLPYVENTTYAGRSSFLARAALDQELNDDNEAIQRARTSVEKLFEEE